MWKLVTEQCTIHYQSQVDPHQLIGSKSSTLFIPQGSLFAVGFGSIISNEEFPVHLITTLIQLDFGVVYFCDQLPKNAIINPHVVYVVCDWAWFSHTLLVDYQNICCAFGSGKSTKVLADKFKRLNTLKCWTVDPITFSYGEVQDIHKAMLPKTLDRTVKEKTLLFDSLSYCPDRGLGDIVMTLVVLKYLHDNGWKIDYYARPAAAKILEGIPWINKVWGTTQGLDMLRDGSCDNVPNPKNYTWHFCLSTGLENYKLPRNLNCRVDSLAELMRLNPKDIKERMPQLYLTEQELEFGKKFMSSEKPNLAVGLISNGSVCRSYPQARISELLNKLTKYYNVIFLDQSPYLLETQKGVVNLSGQLTIRQWLSVIANCDMVLSTDTGIYWMGLGFAKPAVVMFSTIQPELRVKYYPKYIKSLYLKLPCKPCYDRQMVRDQEAWKVCIKTVSCGSAPACITGLTPSMVLKAVKEFSIYRGILK